MSEEAPQFEVNLDLYPLDIQVAVDHMNGQDGTGIPAGGEDGQLIRKHEVTLSHTEWFTLGTINGKNLVSGNQTITLSELGGVPTTTTVNGYALSGNITLTYTDVGAASAAQGGKADTALQPADKSTGGNGSYDAGKLATYDISGNLTAGAYQTGQTSYSDGAISFNGGLITIPAVIGTMATLYDIPDVSGFVPNTRTINGFGLSNDITLTPGDIGAATAAQGALADTALQDESDPAFTAWLSSGTSHGGYGSSDDGKAAIYGPSGDLTASSSISVADGVVQFYGTVEGEAYSHQLIPNPSITNLSSGILMPARTSGVLATLDDIPAAYTLPTASSATLGGVKIGTGLSINGSGVASVSFGTTSSTACVGNDSRLSDARDASYAEVTFTTDGYFIPATARVVVCKGTPAAGTMSAHLPSLSAMTDGQRITVIDGTGLASTTAWITVYPVDFRQKINNVAGSLHFIKAPYAQLVFIADVTNGTWFTDDAILRGGADLPSTIHAATSKTTPVDADELALVDSAASNGLKKLTWANNKATLKTYFDTKYAGLDFADAYFSTGVLNGGVLTVNADNTKFDISAGTGYIVDNWTTPGTPVVTKVTWTAKTAVADTYLTSTASTTVLIDSAGNVVQQTAPPTPQDYREKLVIGKTLHANKTTISGTAQFQHSIPSSVFFSTDMLQFLGVMATGLDITANGANLQLNRAAGSVMRQGTNYASSQQIPNVSTLNAATGISFAYRYRNGSGGFTVGSTVTSVDPDHYDTGTGTLASVPNNKFTNQRVYVFSNGNTFIAPGQTAYNTLAEAVAAIGTETFVVDPQFVDANLRCVISVKQGTTALNVAANAAFKAGGYFGVLQGSAAGGSGLVPGGVSYDIQYNNAGTLGGATITGLVKGNGASSAPTAAVAGTDFVAPATTIGNADLSANRTLADIGAAMASTSQTASFTAVKSGRYHVAGSVTADGSVVVTDPSSPAPATHDIYKIVIDAGYVRIGGVDYYKSRHEITRHYTGSAWETLAPYYSEAPDYAVGIKATARANLGAGAVGDAVFTASTTAAAQTAIDLRRSRAKAVVIENEFISGNTGITGLYAFAVSSGTLTSNSSLVTASHPGVITLRDSTTANGGYYIGTETNTMLLAGGESCEFVFQVGSARSTQTIRLGFQDSNGSTAPTDGVWLEIVGNGTAVVCTGKTSSNSSASSTGTTYTMATGTWFSAAVTVVSSSSVTYAIYNEAGALVWSDTLSTNIPTAAARLTGFGVVATESTTDAAADMLYLDYLNLKIDRALTR